MSRLLFTHWTSGPENQTYCTLYSNQLYQIKPGCLVSGFHIKHTYSYVYPASLICVKICIRCIPVINNNTNLCSTDYVVTYDWKGGGGVKYEPSHICISNPSSVITYLIYLITLLSARANLLLPEPSGGKIRNLSPAPRPRAKCIIGSPKFRVSRILVNCCFAAP